MTINFSTQCRGTAERRIGNSSRSNRCRRMTTSLTFYCPQHRYQNRSNCPVLVIGTSLKAAREYAKLIRLDDYVVASEEKHLLGIRIRGIFCTPGYLDREINNKEKNQVNFSLYYEAMDSMYHRELPKG